MTTTRPKHVEGPCNVLRLTKGKKTIYVFVDPGYDTFSEGICEDVLARTVKDYFMNQMGLADQTVDVAVQLDSPRLKDVLDGKLNVRTMGTYRGSIASYLVGAGTLVRLHPAMLNDLFPTSLAGLEQSPFDGLEGLSAYVDPTVEAAAKEYVAYLQQIESLDLRKSKLLTVLRNIKKYEYHHRVLTDLLQKARMALELFLNEIVPIREMLEKPHTMYLNSIGGEYEAGVPYHISAPMVNGLKGCLGEFWSYWNDYVCLLGALVLADRVNKSTKIRTMVSYNSIVFSHNLLEILVKEMKYTVTHFAFARSPENASIKPRDLTRILGTIPIQEYFLILVPRQGETPDVDQCVDLQEFPEGFK